MVGTVHSGNMENNANESHSGARLDQVAEYAEQDIEFRPNLILMNVGTNDAVTPSPNFPADKIGDRMTNLTERFFDKILGVTIVVSTLLLNTHEGVDERVRKINAQYKDAVKGSQKLGRRVLLADLHPVLKAEDLKDGTHPTDEGYTKMADAWLPAIEEAGKKRLLKEPKDDNPDINVPPGSVGVACVQAKKDLWNWGF